MAIVSTAGYERLFLASLGAGVAAFALAQLLESPVGDEPEVRPTRSREPNGFRRIVDPDVLRIGAVIALAGVAFSAVVSFVDTFSREARIASGAGVFFLAYTVVMALSRLISGRAQDARGDNAVVYPAILSFAAGLACLSAATSPLGIAVAGGLVGLGFGTLLSAMQVIAVNQAPPHRVGVAVSTYLFMLDVGTGAGPLLLGWVVSATSFRVTYLSLAVVIMTTALLYHLVHGRRTVVGGLEAI
jgi:predicted MFS family arabinose efflux permease